MTPGLSLPRQKVQGLSGWRIQHFRPYKVTFGKNFWKKEKIEPLTSSTLKDEVQQYFIGSKESHFCSGTLPTSLENINACKGFQVTSLTRPFCEPLCKVKKVSVSRSIMSDFLWCQAPSSVHGILQARILETVTIPFSRGLSQPRDQTCVSCIAGRFFTIWATRKIL